MRTVADLSFFAMLGLFAIGVAYSFAGRHPRWLWMLRVIEHANVVTRSLDALVRDAILFGDRR